MVRGRAARTLVGLCAGLLLLSGCSEKQDAGATPPPAPPTTAPPSPALPPLGPTDFPVPDEARTQDEAGAEAALRYYLDLVAHQGTKGGQPLRDLSQGCELCTFMADRADQDATAGYTMEGGQAILEYVQTPTLHDGIAEFTFSITQARTAVRDRQGNLVPGRNPDEVRGLRGAALMTWSPSSQAWIMSQLFFTRS